VHGGGGLILALLAALAVAAQVRARRIQPPAPLASRIDVRVERRLDGVEVVLRGARGLAFSFHQARWSAPVEVVEVSGPLTLVGRRDVRRYLLEPTSAASAELRGVWEQMTFRGLVLQVELDLEPGAAATPLRASAARTRWLRR
jgi:hypothetical protein